MKTPGILLGCATAFLLAIPAAAQAGVVETPTKGSPRWSQSRGFSLGLQYLVDVEGADDPAPTSPPGQLFFEEAGQGLALLCGYTFTPLYASR